MKNKLLRSLLFLGLNGLVGCALEKGEDFDENCTNCDSGAVDFSIVESGPVVECTNVLKNEFGNRDMSCLINELPERLKGIVSYEVIYSYGGQRVEFIVDEHSEVQEFNPRSANFVWEVNATVSGIGRIASSNFSSAVDLEDDQEEFSVHSLFERFGHYRFDATDVYDEANQFRTAFVNAVIPNPYGGASLSEEIVRKKTGSETPENVGAIDAWLPMHSDVEHLLFQTYVNGAGDNISKTELAPGSYKISAVSGQDHTIEESVD